MGCELVFFLFLVVAVIVFVVFLMTVDRRNRAIVEANLRAAEAHSQAEARAEAVRLQAAAARRQVEAELARLQRQRDEQRWKYEQMVSLGTQSIALFESLPNHLSVAEKHLDQADVEFADCVFPRFWDAIENAAKAIAPFAQGVRQINENLSRHTEAMKEYADTPPQFPLSHKTVAKLAVANKTAQRMEAMVRKAQSEPTFATIYELRKTNSELRKTNQILIAGFTNLTEALYQMSSQITDSLEGLAWTFNESTRVLHARTGDVVDAIVQHDSEDAQRVEKVVKMLDNIQRGQKPFL